MKEGGWKDGGKGDETGVTEDKNVSFVHYFPYFSFSLSVEISRPLACIRLASGIVQRLESDY